MPNRPNFPIPEDIHPPMQCIQLCIPNEPTYKSVFAGLIYELTYWYNWQRTDGTEGAQCAAVWKEIYNSIDWSTMSCCCPDQPPIVFRWNGNVYEKSTDGGVTWEPAPEWDYRNTSTAWPKPSETGFSNTKCQCADGVIVAFRDQINGQVADDYSAAQILGVIAAVLAIFLSAGTSTAITPLIVGLVSAILGAGVAAWNAAFTTDVWDRLRCNIYEHMTDDESIDQAGLDAVYSQIDSDESGITAATLKGYIGAAGLIGINNMMSSGQGDPDANCSACSECTPCDTQEVLGAWEFYTPSAGVTKVNQVGSSGQYQLFDNTGYVEIDLGTTACIPYIDLSEAYLGTGTVSITLDGYEVYNGPMGGFGGGVPNPDHRIDFTHVKSGSTLRISPLEADGAYFKDITVYFCA